MFNKLKVGTKLALSFFAVLSLAALLAAVALSRMSAMNDEWHLVETVDMAKQSVLAKAHAGLADGVQSFKNYVIRGGDYNKRFDKYMAEIEQAVADYRKIGEASADEQKQLEAVVAGVKIYRTGMAKLTEMRAADAPVGELDKAVAGADKAIAAAIKELSTLVSASVKEASGRMTSLIASARVWLFSVAALAIMLGIAFAFAITRAITRPLREAVAIAQKVAAGDLTSRIETKSRDETGLLLLALRDMNSNLRNIVAEVRVSTDAIGTASQQIAAGNADLSQRTEEQASSLEETASSMEELASTVKQNAENAKQATQLASSASEVAIKGGTVVGEVVQTMSSINESSKKIADIIGVIDGIAFQTNILALNAAVEAARAGEQGRGFAVVASEVRTLAQRSAGAAKEIKELISDSVGKVEAGTRLVDNAGKTMEEIVSSVKRVTDIVSDIAAATQEQSSGIEQVNTAVTQMDQVTQQNAALVEQAAAAAESMREQAGSLGTAVAVFNIGSNDRAAETAPVAAVRAAEVPPVERRGLNRAKNVARLPAKAPKAKVEPRADAKKTGTDDEWSEF
jgi:methyl-accepting chemotaxis protein